MSVQYPVGDTIIVNDVTQVIEVTQTEQNVLTTQVSQVIEVKSPGPQGAQGPTGPAGGTVQLYESSVPPLGAVRGDLWLVTTPLESP